MPKKQPGDRLEFPFSVDAKLVEKKLKESLVKFKAWMKTARITQAIRALRKKRGKPWNRQRLPMCK